jgi:hypothetical protein
MKKIIITFLILSAAFVSCTDAQFSKATGLNNKFTVKVLSCDTIITYHSTGKVSNENGTDGYYFTDAKTNELVEVSGTVIIEQQPK